MKTFVACCCVIACVFCLTGCGPELLIGAAVGGAGVYASSKDTIQGETDLPYEDVWDSAVNTAKFRGTINKQNFDTGTIEAVEGKTKIWIKLDRVTQATTRLKVASRKYKMPNLELAQQIYTKILEQAAPK